MRRSGVVTVDDEVAETSDLGLPGLGFVPNRENHAGTVGHFVTHEAGFADTHLTLHPCRVNQLTFLSARPRMVVGTFVDCRARSETLGHVVRVRFATSAARRLVVPAGIAQVFDNIGTVVVRNDVERLCGDDTLRLARDVEDLPCVEVNGHPTWSSSMRCEAVAADDPDVLQPDVRFVANAGFAPAPGSRALIPSTDGATELVIVGPGTPSEALVVHDRHDALHTFLDRAGDGVVLETLDLRSRVHGFRETTVLPFRCDASVHLRIPAGVAWRYRTTGPHFVRVEYDPIVAGDPDPVAMRVVDRHDPSTLRPPTRWSSPCSPAESSTTPVTA